jgi:phosphorylcholine metabolism protein LicD
MKNIIIFGASKFGEKVFKYFHDKPDLNIVGFCDNDIKKHHTTLFGKTIYPPLALQTMQYDEIIIASSWEFEIEKQLLAMEIPKEKIDIFYSNTKELQFETNSDLQIAEQLMLDIAELLNSNNIMYHIDHGTLLGIIRDGGILPWDIDIDFAIMYNDKDKVINILNSYLPTYKNIYVKDNDWNFEINYQEIKIEELVEKKPMIITLYNKANYKKENDIVLGLDLALKYSFENNLYWMVSKRRLYCKTQICFPSKEYLFKNKMIKIPHDEETYLESLYGNWKEVIKDWHYSKYSNIDSQIAYKDSNH